MKKIFIVLTLVASVTLIVPNAWSKKNVFRAPGGVGIGQTGLMIDASYDPRLDTFLPGYKVINVALINESFNILYLDPEKDQWSIKLQGEKKPYKAIHDLRSVDPKAWSAIPDRAKGFVTYPLALPIGGREVIDLFVPESVDVANFTELDLYFKSMDATFEILVRQ